jgi:hypothetical protein
VDPKDRPSIKDVLRYDYIVNMCRRFKWDLEKLLKFKMIKKKSGESKNLMGLICNKNSNDSFKYEKKMSGFSLLIEKNSRENNKVNLKNHQIINKKNIVDESEFNIIPTSLNTNKNFIENYKKANKKSEQILPKIKISNNIQISDETNKLNFSSFTDNNLNNDSHEEEYSDIMIKISIFLIY